MQFASGVQHHQHFFWRNFSKMKKIKVKNIYYVLDSLNFGKNRQKNKFLS
jgi:hypothetical protein